MVVVFVVVAVVVVVVAVVVFSLLCSVTNRLPCSLGLVENFGFTGFIRKFIPEEVNQTIRKGLL